MQTKLVKNNQASNFATMLQKLGGLEAPVPELEMFEPEPEKPNDKVLSKCLEHLLNKAGYEPVTLVRVDTRSQSSAGAFWSTQSLFECYLDQNQICPGQEQDCQLWKVLQRQLGWELSTGQEDRQRHGLFGRRTLTSVEMHVCNALIKSNINLKRERNCWSAFPRSRLGPEQDLQPYPQPVGHHWGLCRQCLKRKTIFWWLVGTVL